MRAFTVDLLSNEAATGAGQQWPGGRFQFAAAGTFGGATLQLQCLLPDSATFVDVAGVSLTAPGHVMAELPPNRLRVVVSGGTPSGLYARASRIPA
jgi:hypothetical protein